MSMEDVDDYSSVGEEALYSEDEGSPNQHDVSEYGSDAEDSVTVPLNQVDPEEYVRSSVRELVYWEHPVHTALWVTVIGLIFFLTIVSGYSIISIASYLVLVQVVSTTVVVRFSDKLKSVKVLRESFDSESFADQRQLVPPEEMLVIAKGAGAWAASLVYSWHKKVDRGDGRAVAKSSGVLILLSVLGVVLPAPLLLFAMYVLAFSIPPLYKRRQVRKVLDKQMRKLNRGIDDVLGRIGFTGKSRSHSRSRTRSRVRSKESGSVTSNRFLGDRLKDEPGYADISE